MKVITTVSATLSGNRGAEAMLRSMIENISSLAPDTMFNVISVYPHDDVNENNYDNVKIIDGRPKIYMIQCFWEAFLHRYITKVSTERVCSASRALLESSLVLDLSGVSFVDNRGLPILIYNAQCVLIPKWFGNKILKVSQAMGSFNNLINRLLAIYCLKQVDIIAARGSITSSHLRSIGIVHEHCADAAFSLPDSGNLSSHVKVRIDEIKAKNQKIIGFCPSVVVKEYCDKKKMDYLQISLGFIDELSNRGYAILMFAHSGRSFTSKAKNNDLPMCRELFARRKPDTNFYFIDEIMNARELRFTISECDYFIGSRFHSIISALCVMKPFFLIGWSHKYKEVLDEFEISEMALDFKDLSVPKLMSKFLELEIQADSLTDRIRRNLDLVRKKSYKNAELAIKLLGEKNETK